jgi:hypothetical protein
MFGRQERNAVKVAASLESFRLPYSTPYVSKKLEGFYLSQADESKMYGDIWRAIDTIARSDNGTADRAIVTAAFDRVAEMERGDRGLHGARTAAEFHR